ncbi:MAG TPA: FlgD immunoglobulin-like domain containing protein [Candidatus Krumholzibacteria bacterium]|nr:FlgD immunoglobulin-like domain containing protein [Candidatus Krumholzibacteria bacterium]
MYALTSRSYGAPALFLGLAALLVFGTTPVQAGCIDVSIADEITVDPGETVTVPVFVSDVDQGLHPIYSYEIDIQYCPYDTRNTLELVGVNDENTLPASLDWRAPVWSEDDGVIRIVSAGDQPLPGGTRGTLLNLVFEVSPVAQGCDVCDIVVLDVLFNEPDQDNVVCMGDGQVVLDHYACVGEVEFWNQNWINLTRTWQRRPMQEVKTRFLGNCGELPSRSTTFTDEDGWYTLNCLLSCTDENTVTPTRFYDQNPQVRERITTMDASLVLQYVIGSQAADVWNPDNPNAEFLRDDCDVNPPEVASDVSGDGSISAYDASLILRWYVGEIQRFPADNEDLWFFYNRSTCEVDVGTCPSSTDELGEEVEGPDFIGLLLGDVNGSWGDEDTTSDPADVDPLYRETDMTVATLRLGETREEGDAVIVPVLAEGDAALSAGALSFQIDNAAQYEGVRSPRGNGVLTAGHAAGDVLTVAFATGEAFEANGALVELVFDRAADVSMLDAELNDGAVTVVMDNRDVTSASVPNRTTLVVHGNHPNPFNPKTQISFYLPEERRTTVQVYDVFGRVVRTLAMDETMAGEVALEWDGTDDRGGAVASGVYFARVSAGDWTASHKMVLSK